MSEERVRRYFNSLQQKPPAVSGIARAVILDSDTGQQRYTDVEVGAQVIRVSLDALAPRIAGGDVLRLEQTGTAANAEYRLAGVSGNRPTSGMIQFMDDGAYAGGLTAVSGGDIIMGGVGATDPNFFYDFSAGIWQARTGDSINGSWSASGVIISGASAGPHVEISSSGINMYTGTQQGVRLDPSGSGWMGAASSFYWDAAGNVTMAGNVAVNTIDIGGADDTSFHVDAAGNIWSGAATSPNGPFRVTSTGDLYANSSNISGSVVTISGSISGWKITRTSIQDESGYTGMSSAISTEIIDDIRFWAGASSASLANFYVTKSGNLRATGGSFTGTITASSGNFSGYLTIASGGGIYQGTGTPTSPSTGIKIWNDGGAGRLVGYNSTASQAGFGTDGYLYAGENKMILNASGMQVRSTDDSKWLTFYNSNISACPNHQGFLYFQHDNPESLNTGCLNVGMAQNVNNQSNISFYENGIIMYILSNGSARSIMEASYGGIVFNCPVTFAAGHS